jgi:hypothetical protein
MRQFGFPVCLFIILAGLAAAQIPTSGNVFFGYSYYTTDFSSGDRANTNGWEASVEGKVIPWVAFVADIDAHYGSQNFLCSQTSFGCPLTGVISFNGIPTINDSFVERNFLFGPRVSFSVAKFRPFAEFLIGGAHVTLNNSGGSNTSFATATGGGLDYKIIKLIAWRLQGDYVNTRFFGTSQNNLRISTGIVVRF